MTQTEFNKWYLESKDKIEKARSEITSDDFKVWLKK